MSFIDLVCNQCGLLTTVAEKGNAGLKFRCRGCGKILEIPGSKRNAQVAGETDAERLYRLDFEQGAPAPGPIKFQSTGWGRATAPPASTGPSPFETRGGKIQVTIGNHVYTMQGRLGVQAPPALPVDSVIAPKPPPLPPDRPRDSNPGKEGPHSES